MEGLGVWCAMANQAGSGRPQHFCAWSKERLGWVQPAVIDPTVRQKLILAPIEDSPKECVKVLVRPDGYVAWRSRQLPDDDCGKVLLGVLERVLSRTNGAAA